MTDFAVVIPVHDRRTLLGRALASVAAQRTAPAEVIVVDDGSTDGSHEVAEDFGAAVIRQPASGVSAARNRGLEAASAPYVAFLDSDDEWYPEHLSTLATGAGRSSFIATAALATDGALVGSQRRRPLRVTALDRLLYPENPVVTSAVAVDRHLARDAGGFDESMRHSEDLDLWARLLRRAPGLVLPQVTVRYRVHEGQASLDLEAMRAGTAHLLASCSARTRAAVRSRDEWDTLRADGASVSTLLRFAARPRAIRLGALLAHRARGRRIAEGLEARSERHVRPD